MAHKSKKKHLKHVRQQQLEQNHELAESKAKPPGTKATSAALGAARSHKVRLTANAKAAVKSAASMSSAMKAKIAGKRPAKADKSEGIVRSIARAATDKLTAKPKEMMAKAKARVRSLFGLEARAAS